MTISSNFIRRCHVRSSIALISGCMILSIYPRVHANPERMQFDCLIEPKQMVKLASPVVGVIARLNVDRGDVVTKGQVLGKLEDGVEEATLALARAKARNEHIIKATQARLEFLRSKQDRAGQLVAKSFASQAAAEEAQAEARVAEEQLNEAKLNLEVAKLEVWRAEELIKQRHLYSPIDGVVVERLLLPGEYRNEQTPILTLAEMNPLLVEVFVPTAFFGKIRVGSEARVFPEEPIGGSFTAFVTVVDRVLDAASGTFGVRLRLPNPTLALPAGIRCRVEFQPQPPRAEASKPMQNEAIRQER